LKQKDEKYMPKLENEDVIALDVN